MVHKESQAGWRKVSTHTAQNLRSVARSVSSQQLAKLSLPEIDAVVDLIAQMIPAGNVPGMILSGLARLPGRRPPPQQVHQDVRALFKGAEAETATQTPAQTLTLTLPATLWATSITPTVKYPHGNLFTVYYNDSSFYLLNRSKVLRSVSGFGFERITDDGQFTNHFGGWEWQQYFDTSQPERCLRIEIYLSKIPYLLPDECQNRYLSTLQPSEKRDTIFWTTQEGSRQFRVLWMNEEVARCEIQAGRCDFYVP